MAEHAEEEQFEDLPAWSLPAGARDRIALQSIWPEAVTREWAWGGSTGKDVSVCILDSGVERGHPLVGEIQAAGAVLWRARAGGIETALVHRPRYDDWSFPKGKSMPGEHVLLTGMDQ